MQLFVFTVLLLSNVYSMNAFASTPEPVEVPFREAYIPSAFDTNDNSQLVAEGVFPNTCYKLANVKTSLDVPTRTITITQVALKHDAMCLMMLVPFPQVIDLGLLEPGTYTVRDGVTGNNLGTLPVKQAINPGPDDLPYAPVSETDILKKNGEYWIRLTGVTTNSCFTLGDVKFSFEPKVVVVMPILKESRNKSDCHEGRFPFDYSAKLGTLSGRKLVHTRTTNGQSINKIFEF